LGFRPAALMQSLAVRGTRGLTLRFGDAADRRTLEKVVSTAGSILGQATGLKRPALETLDIEIVRTGIWADEEVLYKFVGGCISRYRGVATLRLRYAANSNIRFLTSPASRSEESLSTSHRPWPVVPASRASLNMDHQSDFGINDANFSSKALSQSDVHHIKLWAKQCPSLKTVTLLSGAEWRKGWRRKCA